MNWLSSQLKNFYTCEPPLPKVSLPPVNDKKLDPLIPIECESCVLPCIPSHLNIDKTRPLHNTVTPYILHLVVLTGQTDWPSHIEDEGITGALMDCLDQRRRKNSASASPNKRSAQNIFHLYESTTTTTTQKDRVMVTNASLPSTWSIKGTDILVLPDNIIIANVTKSRIQAFVDFIFGQPTSGFHIHPSPWDNLILVCGHARKDQRCGTIGPMLQQAFNQAIQHYSLQDQCQVMLVSHLGGHAFAGNVILYTHQGLRCIWYGRITPCHCLNIVRYSICQDHVLQEFVRGVLQAGSDKGATAKPYMTMSLEW